MSGVLSSFLSQRGRKGPVREANGKVRGFALPVPTPSSSHARRCASVAGPFFSPWEKKR